jgi:hypothetical protein
MQQHPMITRAKADTFKPNPRYALAHTKAPPTHIPTSVRRALKEPNWLAAMNAEFATLQRNNTWTLVDRPPGVKIISGKWVFTHKIGTDGKLERYKARWVLRGDLQRAGVDLGETFTPVVKPTTIRTVLTIVAPQQWPAHQLDISNAFLHGNLNEKVYCTQPASFVDPERPDAVCRLLSRSLYGLRQAPRAWLNRFMEFVTSVGFIQSRPDSSLFIPRKPAGTAFLLPYVDDMVLSASSDALLQDVIAKIRSALAIKDMGPLQYFLGIDVNAHE